jgi:hypothetical protein
MGRHAIDAEDPLVPSRGDPSAKGLMSKGETMVPTAMALSHLDIVYLDMLSSREPMHQDRMFDRGCSPARPT